MLSYSSARLARRVAGHRASSVMVPWRTVFFAVNFTLAATFAVVCVVCLAMCVVGDGSPGAFMGSVCFMWPAAAVAVGEWALYVRRARRWEQPLGVAYALVGGAILFGLFSEVRESRAESITVGWKFWAVFGSTCVVVGLYALWCGWLRVRRRTFPNPAGLAVGGKSAAP